MTGEDVTAGVQDDPMRKAIIQFKVSLPSGESLWLGRVWKAKRLFARPGVKM